MRPLVSRSISADWKAPPDAVAAAISRAIAEGHYEDAGNPAWSLWLVSGSVRGRTLQLVVDAHSAPGQVHTQALALQVRGELVPDGTGTRLQGWATTPSSRFEWPLVIGVSFVLAVPMLLLGYPAGLVAFFLVLVASIVVQFTLFRFVGRQQLAALPQVEAVLEHVGSRSPL